MEALFDLSKPYHIEADYPSGVAYFSLLNEVYSVRWWKNCLMIDAHDIILYETKNPELQEWLQNVEWLVEQKADARFYRIPAVSFRDRDCKLACMKDSRVLE